MKNRIYMGDLVSHKIFPPVDGVVIGGGYNDFYGTNVLVVQRDDGSTYQDKYDTWELVEHFIDNESEIKKEDLLEKDSDNSDNNEDIIDAELIILD